ncbi:paramyosin [Clonorchis sinensis]|nr:paramyosin [Clonorchis sinensis]
MRGLHSQWSNQPDSPVTRNSGNRSSVTTPVTRAANEVHSHRSRPKKASGRLLLPSDHFERFIGLADTPCSTPPAVPQSTTREVIKLPTPPPGQKRVPFTLEESLALWQGFLEHRDAVDCWARVWRQSFRRSGRRPVDLKDRWRVIQRSATLNRTIAEAYGQWKSEKECNNRVPTLIIVRSS